MSGHATPRANARSLTGAVIDVVAGESIAGIALGMKRSEVEALGLLLEPEGVERVERTGWVSGPLLVLVDPSDRVVLVSIELTETRGLNVSGRSVPPSASLAQIAATVDGCTRGKGSGGDIVECRGASGRLVHFYGAHGSKGVAVVLDAALLR